MLNVIIGEQEFSIRNEFDEITIKEFENISKIVTNTELDLIEQYHAIFLLLGVNETDLDLINLEGFMGIISKWEQREQLSGFTRTISIGMREYAAFDEGKEFKFNLKLIREINKISKTQDLTYSKILAIIFKDGQDEDTFDFEFKSKVFNEVTCDEALPYILAYNDEIKNSLNSFNV